MERIPRNTGSVKASRPPSDLREGVTVGAERKTKRKKKKTKRDGSEKISVALGEIGNVDGGQAVYNSVLHVVHMYVWWAACCRVTIT